MSVAFRRDSDEEHLEPKFELPVPAGPNWVTARGLELIGETVRRLQQELALATEDAKIAAIKRDLRYWQARQITAEVQPPASGDKVEFGVTAHLLIHGRSKHFGIVGDDEADPASGTISFKAPLAQAILGAEVGDLLPLGDTDDAIEISAIVLAPITSG
ncbi:GreA/GreB family elongation factor [Parafrankia sp. BMG5.11]|uniref:GreA/GreB family elongation factor n=1 Tax=Parafrankia sp. BMG5.11 TaxID=222540 RepID=UPI001038680D|nr:GreA/GreB family elongation factor [Parafrankia sp. BMG5.11]TCJ39542.1 nucleoside-diphosphate kinase [Parafrankia sp. BMG5.11]